MQFALLFNPLPSYTAQFADPTKAPALMSAWHAYMGAMAQAGVMVTSVRLQGAHVATTVRVQNDRRVVQDGPFAETKEILGGFVVIEVPSLDEALKWAERSPSSSNGSTEVRPVMA